MSLFIVDVESDGPAPGIYSMVSFGVIKVQRDLENAPFFYGQVRPITANYDQEALAISNITRAEHESYPEAKYVLPTFETWLQNCTEGRPVFVSDNPAYDFMWFAYYFTMIGKKNPFGFSGRRIGDFYCGLKKDYFKATEWKQLRVTKHTHNPVDDARGNAEALIAMADQYGVKLPGVASKKESY